MTGRLRPSGVWLGLALPFAVEQPARAAEITLGPARFDVPPVFEGWTRREADDGLVFERLFEPTAPRGRKGAAARRWACSRRTGIRTSCW
ncbi:MAG: hypothetical protein PGN25_07790 [Methylorubrum populi]